MKENNTPKPKPPNDVGAIKISDSLRIIDVETKQVILEKNHAKPKQH